MTKTKKIREERSVNMGKHDKTEMNFSWQPMPDEWYKARIKTLEQENNKLAEQLEKAEGFVNYLQSKIESDEQRHKESINELKIDMGDLILENNSLRDAVVRAALREVE